MQVLKIPKDSDQLIVISKSEYRNMQKKTKELVIAIKKIQKGEIALRTGKTITDKQLSDYI